MFAVFVLLSTASIASHPVLHDVGMYTHWMKPRRKMVTVARASASKAELRTLHSRQSSISTETGGNKVDFYFFL